MGTRPVRRRRRVAARTGDQKDRCRPAESPKPVRQGESRLEPTADGKRATGTVNGQDLVTAEIKPVPDGCAPAAAVFNYVSMSRETEQIVVIKIPFVGDICKADLVSAKVIAPLGDAFSAFPVAKFVGASEFRNGAVAFSAPVPAGK